MRYTWPSYGSGNPAVQSTATTVGASLATQVTMDAKLVRQGIPDVTVNGKRVAWKVLVLALLAITLWWARPVMDS